MAVFSDFIPELPEVTDLIKTPIYDKDLTDITALALRGNAIRNPLRGGLSNAVGNLRNSISEISAVEKKVAKAKNTFRTAASGFDRFTSSASGVLGPGGLGSTVLGRAQSVASSNPQLKSAISTLKAGKEKMVSAMGQANRLLEHSNLITENIPQVGNIINDAIATPSKFVSDVAGALPSSFPDLVPSFDIPGGFPNFSGLSLPALPNLDLGSIELPSMPNIGDLTGVSIPGIPNPTDILNGFAGSVAGVGKDLVGSLSSYASKLPDLTSTVSGIVSSLNTTAVNTVTGLASSIPAAIPTPANLASLADFSSLTDGLGEMAGGMGDIVGGEAGGVAAAACSSLSLGAGCGSIAQAAGLASSIKNLASTATTGKLIDAVATGPLKSKLGDIASSSLVSGALTAATGGIVNPLTSAAAGGILSSVTGTISDTVKNAGGGIIGGALSRGQELVDTARDLAGQGQSVVGGAVARGRDAITQAQTLAADSISEAQVAAKGIANNTVNTIRDRISQSGDDDQVA